MKHSLIVAATFAAALLAGGLLLADAAQPAPNVTPTPAPVVTPAPKPALAKVQLNDREQMVYQIALLDAEIQTLVDRRDVLVKKLAEMK